MNLKDIEDIIKKKSFLVIILIIIIFFLTIFLLERVNQDGQSKVSFVGINKYNNSEELESIIKVKQSNYSIYIFGSDSDGDNNLDTVNYSVNPMLNISIEGTRIENFKVNSIKITNAQINVSKGRGVRVYPNHILSTSEFCLGNFYEGCNNPINPKDAVDMGSEKEYVLLSEGNFKANFYDETPTNYFLPKFKFSVISVGSFDYDFIIKREGSFNSMNLLQYSGVDPKELVGTFSFDVEIDTSEGLYRKGFVIDVTPDEFVGAGVNNIPIDTIK